MIHGLREAYNDVPNWKYAELLDGFGTGYKTKSYQVRTCKDWDEVLQDQALSDATIPQVRISQNLISAQQIYMTVP